LLTAAPADFPTATREKSTRSAAGDAHWGQVTAQVTEASDEDSSSKGWQQSLHTYS